MTADINELLTRPEGRTLDFKRHEVPLQKALKTLVAFANTAGGILVLGVSDDRSVTGIPDAQREEERYASAITDSIEPPLTVDLDVARHGEADMLIIRVPRVAGPFYLRAEGPDDGVYVRTGSTNRRATAEQREELRRLARAQTFDQRPCLGATLDDLDRAAIRAAFEPTGRIPEEGALESLGLITTAGEWRVPTNAGLILFGTLSARRRFFPDAVFRCARFLGLHKVNFLDQLDPEGTVLGALDEVEKFVRRNTRLASRIEKIRREDVPEYAPVHLREVLVNAVAHTDYSLQGMPLRVAIFDDRLEVENPGGWPVGFSEEDFRAGVSRPRNPVIAHVLRELHVIERWGSGYRRIREASEAGGYPLPTWNDLGLVLRVALHPHPNVQSMVTIDVTNAGQSVKGNVTVNVPENVTINERQHWFIEQIAQGGRVSSDDLARNFEVTVRTAKRDLAALQKAGIIRFVGSRKTGRYELARKP